MDNRENIILCITEGERLDPRILNHLKNIFGFENVKVFPICLNIYNLYQKLTEDNSFDAEFIDTFMLIKEISKGQRNSYNDELLSLERDQISEIFLFFDYDGHDTLVEKHPNCLSKMLSLFNNETELEGYEAGHGQPSFDKQFVRNWLLANPDSDYDLPQDVIDKTIAKYEEAYEMLTGKKL